MKSMKDKIVNRSCPVCNNENNTTLHHIKFGIPTNFIIGNEHFIKQCQECGMVYSDANRGQEDYSSYYGQLSKYIHDMNPSQVSLNKFANTFSHIFAFLEKDFRICDLGCGGGGFLRHLKHKGFSKLTGMDSSNLVGNDHFEFHRTELLDINKASLHDYNFLTCIGVIEHIFDLYRFMENLANSLKNGTYLYIEVPNAEFYHENVISPFQDFNLEHINHFSAISLVNLVESKNFKTIKINNFYQDESPNYKMPVLGLLAQKLDNKKIKNYTYDNNIKDKILHYINKSQESLNRINAYLIEALEHHNEVYIWGAGQLAIKIANLPCFFEKKIISFIDKSPTFLEINNTPVIKPYNTLKKNAPIVVGSVIHKNSIVEDIQKLNLKNTVIFLGEN
jgi:SAM-dependent methyltransferase